MFGQWLCDMAAHDQRLVGITPAMREGSGLVEFEKRFPNRYFDVGIAEQHAVTFAAGLACDGLKPVVAIYSTFLQRAYDQLIHDVAIQNLPVVFALDRAGIVGADGATHCGAFDIAYLRCMPNMSVLAPADENECRQALTTAFRHDHPMRRALSARRRRRRGGRSATLLGELAVGPRRSAPAAASASRSSRSAPCSTRRWRRPSKLDATVANMRFVKPLDSALVAELARTHEAIVTVEEGCVHGRRRQRGAGSACRPQGSTRRCCSSACPTSSSSTATRPSCSRSSGSTRPASSSRS